MDREGEKERNKKGEIVRESKTERKKIKRQL